MASKMNIYQIYDKSLCAERFCFNAKNDKDAEKKLANWLHYHGYMAIASNYMLIPVDQPFYTNNIHNEWVI